MTERHDLEELPGVLRQIAEIAGAPAALAVAAARGGRRVYVPTPDALAAGHWLVEAIGLEPARRVAGGLGAGHIDLPLGPLANGARVRAAIRQSLRAGHSAAEAAALSGAHVRTVWRHRAAQRDDDQGSLL
ncbi:hypothetical protein [Roseospirillum parvum]|uniref:Homeodomain-like domain-containing protein n=1 Tax=Roseospirillum parvum TaxID=83401 RepID=A0A1G8GH27_9PROT|nr:hypothetical protein [Roseospirillum parvum]SDH93640.1 hypothetical protein SAMN05421742_1278 [Roseospirillum parvum]